MAKKLKADEAATQNGISAKDLKGVVKSITTYKDKASEQVGYAGQATKDAVERHNLDRKALTTIVALSRKEPAQAQATLRALIDYADKLDLFSGIDMFDDLIPTMERIIERARQNEADGPSTPGAGVIAEMVHH